MTDTEKNYAKEQAESQLESIIEMLDNLNNAETEEDRDDAQQSIYDDPLSVEVRSGWHTPGSNDGPDEYMILLCTGGPAVRIVGNLNEYNEPESASIEYQDWLTKWEVYPLTREQEESVLEYARCFYFGE